MTLIRGNHDLRSGDPPKEWGITVVDEPWSCDGLSLYHHPPKDEALIDECAYAFAGHVHPCVQVVGAGRDRLRLPCFHLGARVGDVVSRKKQRGQRLGKKLGSVHL